MPEVIAELTADYPVQIEIPALVIVLAKNWRNGVGDGK